MINLKSYVLVDFDHGEFSQIVFPSGQRAQRDSESAMDDGRTQVLSAGMPNT